MNPAEGNPGINKLARAIQGQVQRNTDAHSALVLDFGVIQADYSLLTNTYPKPIPKADYMVCRQLTIGPTNYILTKTQDIGKPHSGSHIHNTINLTDSMGGAVSGTVGEATGPAPDPPNPAEQTAGGDGADGNHQHHVLIPEKMRKLKPGDRVLVAWVQNDAVVVDLVLPATVL